MTREIDGTMDEIKATTDDLDETMAVSMSAMAGLHQKFELFQQEMRWEIVLFVASVTGLVALAVILRFTLA